MSIEGTRALTSQLAMLNGDPNEAELNYTDEEKGKLAPYTTRDTQDPDDQFTEVVTFRVAGGLKRLGEEMTAMLHPWYRTHSDLARDAYFKWLKFLAEDFVAPGSKVEPLALKLDLLQKQAYETDQRRKFTEVVASLDRNLTDLIADGATAKLAEEAAEYCETIMQINDSYWKNRTIREFCEMACFPRLLRTLRGDETYKHSGLVKLLTQWENQRFVQKRDE